RQVEQGGEALAALYPVVAPCQRVGEIMPERLVEALVLLFGDLRLRPGPQGGGRVDGLPLGFLLLPVRALGIIALRLLRHADREGDMVGVAVDQFAQLPRREELVLVLLEMED